MRAPPGRSVGGSLPPLLERGLDLFSRGKLAERLVSLLLVRCPQQRSPQLFFYLFLLTGPLMSELSRTLAANWLSVLATTIA